MSIYKKFELVSLTPKMKQIAAAHAVKRTANIRRQFVPQNAPLSHLESNYVGVIGELTVRKYFGLPIQIEDNYEDHKVDDGDILYNNKIYDVKTDAIPWSIYNKLKIGEIQRYDRYGCRVFSARHLQHLIKYSGGLIFCAFAIPDDSKASRNDFYPDEDMRNLRDSIYSNNYSLIIGHIEQDKIIDNQPTWYTPTDPRGKSSQYNSPNYIFHHSDLHSIKDLNNG